MKSYYKLCGHLFKINLYHNIIVTTTNIVTTINHIHTGIFDDSLGKSAIIITAIIIANAFPKNHKTPFDNIRIHK